MRAKFNDKTDPTYEFENQCSAFRTSCPKCFTRFSPEDTSCPNCGAPRPRCKNRAMEGEEVCRSHATGRAYSLYNKLAATLSDAALEELIEQDDRNLEQEYALAKVALSNALDEQKNPKSKMTSEKLMQLTKDFFYIAEKKKNIEKGQVLNISWNDELVNSLRLRIRKLVRTMDELIKEYVPGEDQQKEALLELRKRTKMIGNLITSPPKDADYVPEEDTEEE